jgi:hypothetical protein
LQEYRIPTQSGRLTPTADYAPSQYLQDRAMTTRRPLQTLSPPSASVLNTRYTLSLQHTNGYVAMEEQHQEDVASVVSDLSSLENGADDFERLMIQNARDERRLNEGLHGRVQAFRKARTHPRVGLTMDNLERNNARDGQATHVQFESPPSSSGSTRSDPAIRAPPGWGRKSRSNRNWMRTITYEDEEQQTPVTAADDTPNGADDDQYPPHPEDSPLSRKSSVHGTPRNDRSAEWDLTFELNEASIIASTPYIPRNTALDDIREREIASLKEEAVAIARLGRIRAGSPEETRRPRSASNRSANNAADGANGAEVDHVAQGPASPDKRLRTRTNSWKSIGKSQAVTGTGKENSPVTVMKTTTESMSIVERSVPATSQARPVRHRREDSQDLLRRLARLSNTPSPAHAAAARPQTAPANPANSSSQAMIANSTPTPSEGNAELPRESPPPDIPVEPPAPAEDVSQREEPEKIPPESEEPPAASQQLPSKESGEPPAEDVDATPIPVEQSVLLPKTPIVTGAWVDTPARTTRKPISTTRTPLQSPKKSPQKGKESEKGKEPAQAAVPIADQGPVGVATEVTRPQLPSSALHALVQEAKSHHRRQSADYGDSTINSLEELISTPPETEIDEDTLQDLRLDQAAPRNEAERQRQNEVQQLFRMNDKLRAARTSIRDASRGMKRVEDRVEHSEELEDARTTTRVSSRECPCMAEGGAHHFSLWRWSKGFFWDESLKTKRQGTRWRSWSGLTALSIIMVVSLLWWISEEIAWYVDLAVIARQECGANTSNSEFYCQHAYTDYSPYPFSVNPDAPAFPFVIPTLFYRNLIRFWWAPIWSLITWLWTSIFGADTTTHFASESLKAGMRNAATQTAAWARSATRTVTIGASSIAEEATWEQSMMNDEVVR